MPQMRNPVGLKQSFLEFMNWIWDGDTPVRMKGEETGELDVINEGKQTDGTITAFRTEDTGEQTQVTYGKQTGGTITAQKVEATGEQDIVLHGKDSGGNIDALRTNANQELVVEVSGSATTPIEVDSVELTASEAELWDPGTTGSDLYEVYYNIVHHIDGAGVNRNPCKVTVGKGVGGAAVAIPNWWTYAEGLGFPGETGWKGPFRIAGDDTVRGFSSTIKTALIHFRVNQVVAA